MASRTSWAVIGLGALALVGSATVVVYGQDGGGGSGLVPQKFNHAAHESRGQKVAENCEQCHAPDPKGELIPPGIKGHKPCLSSGCHASDFLAVGMKDKASEKYIRAAQMCLGCHRTVPQPHVKMGAGNAFKNNDAPGYHVDFDHFKHTERAKCRDCHIVNPITFARELDRPTHDECGKCHGANASPPMTACGNCHSDPGPAVYYKNRRESKGKIVACDGKQYKELTRGGKKKVTCFTHERLEHREKDGMRVECAMCHGVVADEKHKADYKTVRDVFANPIIDKDHEVAHARCGQCHPHDKDVKLSSGKSGSCTKCHTDQMGSVF